MDKYKISKLSDLEKHRETIENHLSEIEAILQADFPEEFSVAYQHWIPQIKTALKHSTKWLDRGQYSMQYTLDRILDKINDKYNKGVSKYIK